MSELNFLDGSKIVNSLLKINLDEQNILAKSKHNFPIYKEWLNQLLVLILPPLIVLFPSVLPLSIHLYALSNIILFVL